jgi:hypothetical protein
MIAARVVATWIGKMIHHHIASWMNQILRGVVDAMAHQEWEDHQGWVVQVDAVHMELLLVLV